MIVRIRYMFIVNYPIELRVVYHFVQMLLLQVRERTIVKSP